MSCRWPKDPKGDTRHEERQAKPAKCVSRMPTIYKQLANENTVPRFED